MLRGIGDREASPVSKTFDGAFALREVLKNVKTMRMRRSLRDSRKSRDGKTLENLGHYAPQTEQPIVDLKEETVLEYLNDGAVPTETVKNILRQRGIVKIQQKAENGTVKLVWTKRA